MNTEPPPPPKWVKERNDVHGPFSRMFMRSGHPSHQDRNWSWVVNWPTDHSSQDRPWRVTLYKSGDKTKKGAESIAEKPLLVCTFPYSDRPINSVGKNEWRKGMAYSIWRVFFLSDDNLHRQANSTSKQRREEDPSAVSYTHLTLPTRRTV